MDINGPSDWIHCPDEAVRERIAREMRERRHALYVTQRPKGAPFSRVMRGEKLTGEYPLVRWSGSAPAGGAETHRVLSSTN